MDTYLILSKKEVFPWSCFPHTMTLFNLVSLPSYFCNWATPFWLGLFQFFTGLPPVTVLLRCFYEIQCNQPVSICRNNPKVMIKTHLRDFLLLKWCLNTQHVIGKHCMFIRQTFGSNKKGIFIWNQCIFLHSLTSVLLPHIQSLCRSHITANKCLFFNLAPKRNRPSLSANEKCYLLRQS